MLDLAIGRQLQIPILRRHRRIQLHPNTVFVSNQSDAACVHAAQGRGVDGELGFVAIGGRVAGCQGVAVYLLFAGDNVQGVGVHFAGQGHRASDHIKAFGVGSIQTITKNGHGTALHIKAAQFPVFHDGLPGGQGGVVSIDKATTVTADAVRVGHHHIGAGTAYFDVTGQVGGVLTDHFVEDQAGGAVFQVGVTFDVTTQLSLCELLAVVEDQAFIADVEVVVEILRDALAVGVFDIDHRHAIGRLIQGGPTIGAMGWRDGLGGQQHGLPDQQQRQAVNQATFHPRHRAR